MTVILSSNRTKKKKDLNLCNRDSLSSNMVHDVSGAGGLQSGQCGKWCRWVILCGLSIVFWRSDTVGSKNANCCQEISLISIFESSPTRRPNLHLNIAHDEDLFTPARMCSWAYAQRGKNIISAIIASCLEARSWHEIRFNSRSLR